MSLLEKGLEADLARFFEEDDLQGNAFYLRELPQSDVQCQLKIKSDLLLSGLPYFVGAFNYLGANLKYDDFKIHEGKNFARGEVITFNLPFAIRPFVAAFRAMDRRLIEASWCLGETPIATFFRVTLPICWPGILAGLVLTFAHSVGEFGVVLMIGGNRPQITRTLSISIYDQVQEMRMESAGQTALLLLMFSFLVLSLTQWIGRREVGV